ncbi:MAG: hypothetical protein IJ485_00835 [Lachnospiraceae bacterium]|nr:hypothetical protein [Lachnospiraceae bacterium]
MRIGSSNIGMESARRYSSEMRQTLKFSVTRQTSTLEELGENGLENLLLSSDEAETEDGTPVEENTENKLSEFRNRLSNARSIDRVAVRDERQAYQKIRQECMRFLFQLLFGRQKESDSLTEDVGEIVAEESTTSDEMMQTMFSSVNVTTTELDLEILFREQEETSFSTEGTVVTADGREMTFHLGLDMSRSFSAYYSAHYEKQSVALCDPLVINLDSNIASVSDQKFYFDLDADGEMESISQLADGSGYLAVDFNGDGVIQDGSELFGTKTCDGFADLANFDSDNNGWIDESDDIWNKLLVWTKDANGEEQLCHIAKKGVGAICLQNAETDFSLTSSEDNHVNGIIRKTGIFLYENGNVGTIQHLDLAT